MPTGALSQYPPGIVAVPTGPLSRYTPFWISLFGLAAPPGTRMSLTQGGNVGENLNTSIRSMLMPNPEMQWVWIVGDDHTFHPDILERLLAHDRDIVVPLCALRFAPFGPSVWLDDKAADWSQIPQKGLTPISGTGYAGGLFKRKVFEAIGDPWWDIGPIGRYRPQWGEDLWFCQKVRQAGFTILLDPEIPIGHMTSVVLDPAWSEGGWGVALDMGHTVSQVKPLNGD